MKTGHIIRTAVRALQRHRLRTVFIMASSVAGAAALTLVLSLGGGAKRKMLSTASQLFGNAGIVLTAGGHQLMGGPRSDGARLAIDDIEAVVREVPGIEAWDPQQVMIASARANGATATVRVLGQSERSAHVWSRGVSAGRYFDAGDVRRLERVALIGETAARDLFAGRDPIDGEILIESVPFTVIGVLEKFGTDIHGMDRDNEIVVPISTLMRRLANTDTIAAVKFLAANPDHATETAAAIRGALRARHGLTGDQPDDFGMITPVVVQSMMAKARRVVALYLPLASMVILIVGGIVASTLMLGSVNARVSEIGLRRAVGARPADISRQFIVESAISMLGGGILGAVIGAGATEVVAMHVHYEGVFSWFAIAAGITMAGAVGALAGVLPARRAARLQPVDALR